MPFLPKKRIFLDYASGTPVLHEVEQVMHEYLKYKFYNPSALYREGLNTKRDLEHLRSVVSDLLSVGKKDIIFTSGGTESINLSVIGVYEKFKELYPRKKPHIIISSIEHPAVYESALEAKRRGARLSIVGVNEDGLVSTEEIKKLITTSTCLVSLSLANNEIGVTLPIPEVGRIVRKFRKEKNSSFPLLHTDASQAPTCMRVDVGALGVDLLTLDGGKIYGPRGVGVLVARPIVVLDPIMWGGAHERGLRPGTENLFLIAGFCKALEIVTKDWEREHRRLSKLKKYFIEGLEKKIKNIIIHGNVNSTLPSILSVGFSGINAEYLLLFLDEEGIAVSLGSACNNLKNEESGSKIILALGRGDLKDSTIRFSFGRNTTKSDLKFTLKKLNKIISSKR